MTETALSPKQLSEEFNLSLSSVYKYLQQGKMPGAIKVCGTWRIIRSEFIAGSRPEKVIDQMPKRGEAMARVIQLREVS